MTNSIKNTLKKISTFLIKWDNEHYNQYIGILGIMGGLLHLVFLVKTLLGYGFNDWTEIRAVAILGLFSLVLLPKNINDYRLFHKFIYEFALFVALPALFYPKVMINTNSAYHMSALILSGVVYGLLAQPLVGLISMFGCSLVILQFVESPEEFKTMASVSGVSIAGFIISLSLQASKKSAMKELAKQKAYKTKFESLGHMAGGICHEINTPVMTISGTLEILLSELNHEVIDTEFAKRSIKKSFNSINKISAITKNLQIFSQDFFIPNQDKCNLYSCIMNLKNLYLFELNKDAIKFIFSDETISIAKKFLVSEYILKNSLENLIKNSIDALARNQNDKWIEIAVEENKEEVQISVIDNGCGISKEHIEKIADPFFTTKPIGEGMGLGLSVVKGLVESVGGKFFIDEHSSHTKFTIIYSSLEKDLSPILTNNSDEKILVNKSQAIA